METLWQYGIGCAVLPVLVALLHPIFSLLTRPLVYVVVVIQVLAVPAYVMLDPDISFGADTYSFGAGLGMMLILGIESVFVAGSAVGLIVAMAYLRRRERHR